MSCDEARELLVLEPYGELTFDQEESVESHVAACPQCRAERAALAAMRQALDNEAAEPSLELLSACRQDLRKQLAAANSASRPFWRKWFAAETSASRPFWRKSFAGSGFLHWAAKPAMAIGLLAAGFFGARLAPTEKPPAPGAPVARNVRFIEPAAGGRVRIVYDEVSRRQLDGRVDDQLVREMLLAATHAPDDPGLRVDSVEYLKTRSEQVDVRKALLRALETDSNEGVRLKALEALKPYAGQREVRAALTKVLLADTSATVRTQTIDLLVNTRRDESELAGVLQDLMRREQNSYIRQRGQTALRAMNASLETF